MSTENELDQMIDHCEMLQKARDSFDREAERLRQGMESIQRQIRNTPRRDATIEKIRIITETCLTNVERT